MHIGDDTDDIGNSMDDVILPCSGRVSSTSSESMKLRLTVYNAIMLSLQPFLALCNKIFNILCGCNQGRLWFHELIYFASCSLLTMLT